jgi:hypothetical protein
VKAATVTTKLWVLRPTNIKLSCVNLDLGALPVDVDALHLLVRELAAKVAHDDAQLVAAHAEVERLRLVIKRLQRKEFGRRSERLDDDRLALALEDLDADLARTEAAQPSLLPDARPQARQRALPEHLLREDVAIDIEGCVCPCCGGALQRMRAHLRCARADGNEHGIDLGRARRDTACHLPVDGLVNR